MKPFKIPLVSVGPGSQPGDDALDYLRLPQGMRTFSMPELPAPEVLGDCNAARAVIEQLAQALDALCAGGGTAAFEVTPMQAWQREVLDQWLGEGEVAAIIDGPAPVRVQETVFAGIWRVRHHDGAGQVMSDVIEVGAAPSLIAAAVSSGANVTFEPAPPPAGVMNAPGVLVEIAGALGKYRPGRTAHVINLTLLPCTPTDAVYLDETLGHGPVTILSRGYGNCRLTSTKVRRVWRVRFFNSQDKLILDTIEITGLPEAAMAAREDFEDSRERLRELLDWINGA